MPETAFLGAQIAPKSLSAGASPPTPLGELTALPQIPYYESKVQRGDMFLKHFARVGNGILSLTLTTAVRDGMC